MSRDTGSAGILVLGMHRSGTSALSRVLSIGGADIGARVLGASKGNEAGHWEDTLAVEVHERLLSRFGTRWDEPYSLPSDWKQSEAAAQARSTIRGYLATNRSKHRLWAVKDPRLSLFAPLWIEAAAELELPISAVVVLRHPLQVAHSLAARDGIAPGRAMLLWLESTLASVAHAEQIPSAIVEYEDILADWRKSVALLARVSGVGALHYDDAAASRVDQFLDASLRHHATTDLSSVPGAVSDVWKALSALTPTGSVPRGTAAELSGPGATVRELLHPVLDEIRVEKRALWQRIALAEGPLAQATSSVAAELPAGLEELRQRVDSHHRDLVQTFSDDIRQMQARVLEATQAQAGSERDAQVARELAPRLTALGPLIAEGRNAVIDAISVDLRRMQEVTATALSSTAVAEGRVRQAMQRSDEFQRDADTQLARAEVAEQALLKLQANADVLQRLNTDRQREIDGLRAEISRLRELAALLESIMSSHSWRWTRPIRFARRLLSGGLSTVDRAKLRSLVRSTQATLLPAGLRRLLLRRSSAGAEGVGNASTESAPKLSEMQAGLPDVFVWSVIDWHFRIQRPQHMARALAEKGHRVFYISNNFVDSEEPGFSVDSLDAQGRLFQVHLHHHTAPAIYFGMPDELQVERMRASLTPLLGWTRTTSSVSVVQHPYWSALVRAVPNARVVYDCMDHHGGFNNNAPSVLEGEAALIADSDLVVVTSEWLEQEIGSQSKAVVTIRNAAQYDFFSAPPKKMFRDPQGRRVIGYYGAIAEWFDVDLVRAVALGNPDDLLVLVGSDTTGAAAALSDLANVQCVGEVAYQQLPYWLHGFDVCLLPFKVMPLTLATNPVKIYEYLAAGKPVVAVDLPEMAQFDGLIEVASDTAGFVSAVGRLLALGRDPTLIHARQAFAKQQTWAHRAKALDDAIAAIVEPQVSVIVLTYNNLSYTQACLSSVEAYSDYPRLEVIVVDNASSDGSREWLAQWARETSAAGHQRRVIQNEANLGFSAGNNVGLHAANGDFLVVLNNDTYVTPGWVRTLCAHLRRDASLGLVGPTTNNIGNEAKIDIDYSDMEEMIARAGEHTRTNPGRSRRMRNAAFFCVAMSRSTYERVGEMDEDFGVGFFEDDDYCRRVESSGLEIACAEDVFIHHHLSASFDKLGAERKRELFEQNKAIYEKKWGQWEPHAYRPSVESDSPVR